MKKIIYSKNERNHCLAIRTDILEDEEGVRYVRKLPEFPEGKLHVEAIYHWYEAFSRALEGTRLSYNVCSLIPGGVELEYLAGDAWRNISYRWKRSRASSLARRSFWTISNL